jgi:uncharacterized protein DUF4124
MRAILFTLLLVPCSAVVAATVYKWVDQNGVTHYSDQPNPGAEKVKVDSAQSYQANANPPNAPRDIVLPKEEPSGPAYSSCTISSPSNDEVFVNVTSVSASMLLQPNLLAGHRVAVSLDGKRIEGVSGASSAFTVTPVYRGSHTLNLIVEDANGSVVCSSPAITFHVRQPSVQAPRAPNRPRF